MENDLSGGKLMRTVIGADFNLTFVNTLEFPEIVAFPCKVKIAPVLKIVDAENFFNAEICFKTDAFVCHTPFPQSIFNFYDKNANK
jgi:hypothetical protein